MQWEAWPSRWKAALQACERLGGETSELIIERPTSTAAVEAVEADLGIAIPGSFRTVLLEFSRKVDVRWLLPDQPKLPFRGMFSGECYWDITQLADLERVRQGWVEHVFSNSDDPYDRVWHNKLTVLAVPNGDCVALDMASPSEPPVVYLSHDGGEGHGYVLGKSFIEFIDNWSLLGCPGSEDWQMMPFLPDSTSGLDPNCENARVWRKWFGLEGIK
jgi:SMI1/KNR4 family protein SUKH-1